ncbi:hypothetical protein G7Y89_g7941 [Cudoniella acicularis]|uniref:Peptidase A1 domain-containing protein n=1 Tax=Cudoniella acicularis TaxID=354080 RepID=A0A8H4W126_9HELO|nr:hypothetical protein G7Y89_g7941 [Cudoniella acicularis]
MTEAVNVVSMEIAKSMVTKNRRVKRSTVTESLINDIPTQPYLTTIQIGTPGQSITVALDTGSSDTWVLSNSTLICQSKNQSESSGSSCLFGTFHESSSSTFKDLLPSGFKIQSQNSQVEGDYFIDDLTFGRAKVQNLQMGLASGQTNVNLGVMGIGYDTNEAILKDQGKSKYPNIIDELVSQGLINTEAYSLYLDDLTTSTGSILFGGIDTLKYTGSIISVPIQPDPIEGSFGGLTSSFTILLTSLKVNNDSFTSNIDNLNIAVPVILDSSTTEIYLPDTFSDQIWLEAGAINDFDNSENAFVNCNLNGSGVTYNFQFGGYNGPIISVAIAELLQPMSGAELEQIGFKSPFENTCSFGILPGENGPYILGDVFLRSAYVVFDLKNNQIGLAQTDFNSNSSNVVEISSNASGIPFASVDASDVLAMKTEIGILRTIFSKGAAMAIVAPFSFGGLFVLIISGFFSLMGGVGANIEAFLVGSVADNGSTVGEIKITGYLSIMYLREGHGDILFVTPTPTSGTSASASRFTSGSPHPSQIRIPEIRLYPYYRVTAVEISLIPQPSALSLSASPRDLEDALGLLCNRLSGKRVGGLKELRTPGAVLIQCEE